MIADTQYILIKGWRCVFNVKLHKGTNTEGTYTKGRIIFHQISKK
jgi:hypothetical protein